MTDSEMLESLIRQSGLRKSYIAEYLGISRAAFSAKLHSKVDFRLKEIVLLCDLLCIPPDARELIFFTRKVDR